MKKQAMEISRAVRFLALLLVIVMFFGMQGFSVLAQTVSGNDAGQEASLEDRDSSDDGKQVDGVQIDSEEERDDGDSVSGADVPKVDGEDPDKSDGEEEAEGVFTPANPVHHCTGKNDGSDYTDYSYIWFGSYPQGEVTDEAVIAAIDSAIDAGEGSVGTGVDVWVDGRKYRRISKSDTDNDSYFDSMENNGYRYFEWERMKWRVLQNNGNTLFVVADKAVDCKKYNEEHTDITWENSTLRKWLNDSFYQTAFSSEEREAVVEQSIVNEDNPYYGTEGGNNTIDKIHLLSIDEVTNGAYGFCTDAEIYSMSRRIKRSDYARARGVGGTDEGNCGWWLRTPGDYAFRAESVFPDGHVTKAGMFDGVNKSYEGVVPALYINITSDTWILADDATSGSGGDITLTTPDRASDDPFYDEDYDRTEWSYVYFGSYPQTEVTGAELTSAITGASYDSNGDALVNGTKYRRLSSTDVNHTEYFGSNTYRYFKWERIRWRILKNEGDTLFVMADQLLDGGNYHNRKTAVTWQTSRIRSFLNQTFYAAAFSALEQQAVVPWTVKNADNPYSGTMGGSDTQDKVYMLSLEEATNTEYGFCGTDGVSSESRRIQVSDYAHVRGVTRHQATGNGMYWLRTPGNNSDEALIVLSYGAVTWGDDEEDNRVTYNNLGYAPVMHIDIDCADYHEEPQNPIHNCTEINDESGDSDTTEYSYVYFGSYPQTEVTGAALTYAIRNASYDGNGDAWVDGTKYRRISKTDTNYNGYFGTGAYRYFKWERIRWRVLKNEGDTMFVMADSALDCKTYHNQAVSVTWKDSTMRSFLNQTFYQTAFSGEEQADVVQWSVANENNPYYGTAGGGITSDKVWLLSYAESVNPDYGFCQNANHCSASRRLGTSDYAHVMGASLTEDLSSGDDGSYSGNYDGKCLWWLRTPGNAEKAENAMAYCSGQSSYTGSRVTYVNLACVPVMHIRMESGLWRTSDDGTSGSGGGTAPVVNPPVVNPPVVNPPVVNPPAGGSTLAKPALSAKIDSYDSVKLSWNYVNSAAGYYVYRSTSPNSGYVRIAAVSTTVYTDKKLKKGKTYYYRVAAYKGSTVGAVSNTASKKVLGRPKKPKLKIKIHAAEKMYELNWGKINDATKLEIWRSNKKNGKYKKWKTVSAKKYIGCYLGMPEGQFLYWFKIKTYYVADGKKIYSKESKPIGVGFR